MARRPSCAEALALEVRDLSLDSDLPTIRVRQGKGSKARLVPVHPELHAGLTNALQFGNIDREDRIVTASRSTADRWIRAAAARAEDLGAIPLAGAYRAIRCDIPTLGTCWLTGYRSTT